jgi:hypothetical protein
MAVNRDFCPECNGISAHEAELRTSTRIDGEEMGVTQDYKLAVKWYRKTAEQGD